MEDRRTRIAYIGMEIPALSATFIYNEILSLEDNNFEVIPISVHYPDNPAEDENISGLKNKTSFLYNMSFQAFMLSNIKCFFKFPLKYFKTLLMSIKDSLDVGILSHTGIGILYRFFVASKAVEIITASNCCHIHSHFAHVATDIAMYASGISGIPFSFTSHANDLFERGWLLRKKVERSKFAVTISKYNLNFLKNLGAPENKIRIIHCGVDTEKFYTDSKEPENTTPEIGTVGRMVEKKGFDTLITACHILKKKNQNFHLEIAGTGPLYEDLKKQINTSGLNKEIDLIGALPHKKIPGWLQRKDIFVLPCKRDKRGDMDGIPVVLMEAMAMGIPVISSNISGIPELIEDGKSGLLIEENDAEALANAIIKMTTDMQFRELAKTNAVLKVKDEFELSKNTSRLSMLFRETVA